MCYVVYLRLNELCDGLCSIFTFERVVLCVTKRVSGGSIKHVSFQKVVFYEHSTIKSLYWLIMKIVKMLKDVVPLAFSIVIPFSLVKFAVQLFYH